MMEQDNSDTGKKIGRPATGQGHPVMVRFAPDLLDALDAYRDIAVDHPSRPEAIRRLVADRLTELGITGEDLQ